jgi:hypothetical protein
MRLYKASELLELKKIISSKLEGWGEKWLSPNHDLVVNCILDFKCGLNIQVENGLYIDTTDSSLAFLLSAQETELTEKANKIFTDVWSNAKQDLVNIFKSERVKGSSLDELSKFGSGAVCIECQVQAQKLNIVLSQDVVNLFLDEPVYLQSNSTLTELPHAVSEQLVSLTLNTNPLECSYRQIKELSVGDVIKIDHSVSEQLKILLDGNKQIAEAFLARTGLIKTAVVEG